MRATLGWLRGAAGALAAGRRGDVARCAAALWRGACADRRAGSRELRGACADRRPAGARSEREAVGAAFFGVLSSLAVLARGLSGCGGRRRSTRPRARTRGAAGSPARAAPLSPARACGAEELAEEDSRPRINESSGARGSENAGSRSSPSDSDSDSEDDSDSARRLLGITSRGCTLFAVPRGAASEIGRTRLHCESRQASQQTMHENRH